MSQVIDTRYQLQSEQPIDEDALFEVYKATDQMENRSVILRILKEEYARNNEIVTKFRAAFTEFHLNVKNTNNLAQIFQISGGSTAYIVQEFIDGQTLEEFLRAHPNLSAQDFIGIFQQICEGLHSLHNGKSYHYSVVPKNIIVNNNNQVKLVGFGSLCPALGQKDLIQKVTIGTENFIAPEILEGRDQNAITGACDIYSLGKVIQSLPIDTDTTILSKATHRDPQNRYQKARDFGAEAVRLFAVNQPNPDPEDNQAHVTPPNRGGLNLPTIGEQTTRPNDPEPFTFVLSEISGVDWSQTTVECLNTPEFAIFDSNTLTFRWRPGSEDIGSHRIEFRVRSGTSEQTLVLPIRVRGSIRRDSQNADREGGMRVIWSLPSDFSFSPKDTARFNVNNPDPSRYRIDLSSPPSQAKSAKYNKATGEVTWKLSKGNIGHHVFVFEIVDLRNPNRAQKRPVTVSVEESTTHPPDPDVWGDYIRSFTWIYNLILLFAGAFAVVLFTNEMFIGFGLLIVLEGIYLVVAGQSEKFQDYLKKTKGGSS